MKVAAIQMTSSQSVVDNLQLARSLLETAKQSNAQCVVLPENFAFMGQHEKDKYAIAEAFGEGPIQDFLRQMAIQGEFYLFAGTIPVRHPDGNKAFATHLVYSPQGECIAHYEKIHLFDVNVTDEEKYQESDSIQPGKEIVTVDCLGVRIGLSICYDLRFPELYRALTEKGASILLVPSAFTWLTGQAHWEVLIRARAIENMCYVIGANQCGHHANGRRTWGHSMIVDYWGRIVSSLQESPGIITHDIDTASQALQRKKFPALDHRRV